jgi:ethanolamine ammonia-lyase large subunit
LNLLPAPEFTDWLRRMSLLGEGGRLAAPGAANTLVRGLLA